MKKKVLYIYLLFALASLFTCIKNGGEIINKQSPYLGSELSGIESELFAHGIVANDYQTGDLAITPDGNEIYFGIRSAGHYSILVTKKIDQGWTRPEVLQHMEDPSYLNIEPNKLPD